MVQTILRQILEDGGMDDLAVCAYSLNTSGAYETRPLFFYHIGKTGGMGVHLALKSALSLSRFSGDESQRYIRFQPGSDDFFLAMALTRRGPIRAVTFEGGPGARTFGIHEELGHDWRLMTLVRDPFDRLVSNYLHDIRRGDRPGPAGPDDFMSYADQPTNRDYQCKMLSRVGSRDCDGKDAFDEAIANLAGFDWVARTADLEEILLSVWSVYGFYPFLSQRIHRNPLKKDDFEGLRDDVYEINRFDRDLFDHVSNHRRFRFDVAQEKDRQTELAPLFAVAVETDHDDVGRWPLLYGQMPGLLQFAHNKGGTLKDLSALLQPPPEAPPA